MLMLRGLGKGLANILFPRTCLACKERLAGEEIDNLVCQGCWGKIEKNLPPFCHSCGRRLDKKGFAKNICPRCLKEKTYFDRAFSPCRYTGVIKELIHAFKYNGKDYLSLPLSRLLIDFIKEYSLPIKDMELIVPVPMHKVRLREREYNQAQLLGEHLGRAFDKPVLTGVLVRNRNTRTQTELKTEERLNNVKDSFSLSGNARVSGKNILLVDDVLTTGATSSEAASVLKKAGANIVFVLTLAN